MCVQRCKTIKPSTIEIIACSIIFQQDTARYLNNVTLQKEKTTPDTMLFGKYEYLMLKHKHLAIVYINPIGTINQSLEITDCFFCKILLMYTYIYQILIICQTMHFANIISNFLQIMSLVAIDGFDGLQILMKDINHNSVELIRSYSSID